MLSNQNNYEYNQNYYKNNKQNSNRLGLYFYKNVIKRQKLIIKFSKVGKGFALVLIRC